MQSSYLYFAVAAVLEIAGCYMFWMWLRQGADVLWLIPGLLALALFALALTQIEVSLAGRAYAAYGGIYIVASLIWLSVIEHARPGLTDILGALLCLLGAAVILFGAGGGGSSA